MHLHHLNWLAILVAAISTMVVGFLWYSPVLFAKPWMREMGYDPNDKARTLEMQKSAGPAYAGSFVASLATIDLGKPLRPHRAEFGPDGLLYVTAELANAIDVIDPSKRKVLAEIPTGEPQSHMLVLSSDGRRGYTANVGAGSVSVLDLTNRKLIATIPVAKSVQRISISPDGRRIFTHDQDAPRVAVIDTASNKISNWITLPDVAYASAPTPDGRWLLAVSRVANHLLVVDLQTLKVAQSLDVPGGSSEILVRPGGEIAYVSGTGAGKIAVLDLGSWKMQPPIDLTPGVDGLAWAPALPQ